MTRPKPRAVPKLATGIPGIDHITDGGLPKDRTTLVAGTAGSAKTVFATQFLAAGVARGQPGVFVTFEERPQDIVANCAGLGWPIQRWLEEGLWTFVDASPKPGEEVVAGAYDLSGLLARVRHAVAKVGAQRLAMDSIGGLFTQLHDNVAVRNGLLRIVRGLNETGVTAIITAERSREYNGISRHGVEEFVTDNVIILRNVLEKEQRRRTIEVLKFRGTDHRKGEYPFTVLPGEGIVAIPLSAIRLTQPSTGVNIPSGLPELDRMCGGGFFRDSIVLVSGATGTGKTLICTHFLTGGAQVGERCLMFAFEESRDQLLRNAQGWGMDFPAMEQRGLLRVSSAYPESASMEDHLLRMRNEIEAFQPQRIAVDSISALERTATPKSFRQFVLILTSLLKEKQIATIMTTTTPSLMGSASVTERHISTLTDTIILLRYVELAGSMRRGIMVLKMRGSNHDKDIREFTIDGEGMHVGKPFRNVSGILSGAPTGTVAQELENLREMMGEGAL